MDNQYYAESAVLLIRTVFGLFALAVWLRLLLQWLRADFYNPVSQFIVKVTNPLLAPLRRVIPGLGGIDLAAILLLAVTKAIEIALVSLARAQGITAGGLGVLVVAEILNLIVTVYTISIIAQAVLSWLGPGGYNPAVALMHQINAPLLAPARRLLPSLGGVDLSPVVVLVVLQLIKILVINQLAGIGHGMV